MAKIWQIRGFDGANQIFEGEMPGQMTESEISTTLQRLAARHLSEAEIVSASLRKRAPSYVPLLERIGRGSPICYGQNPYFTADRREK